MHSDGTDAPGNAFGRVATEFESRKLLSSSPNFSCNVFSCRYVSAAPSSSGVVKCAKCVIYARMISPFDRTHANSSSKFQ